MYGEGTMEPRRMNPFVQVRTGDPCLSLMLLFRTGSSTRSADLLQARYLIKLWPGLVKVRLTVP